ncbi:MULTISPECIES: hypothetical protein [unclassified Rhodococcus (in: high G+C Gram-positive bacteria)]|uniref:hypothetical protein n=1 Tax=Rhodococcus sp. SJ-3 TaxID=3454628 RepID=UPI003F7A0C3B
MTTESLFAVCILPGCTQPVADELTPCQTCRTLFGPMLQETDRPRTLTHADIEARDNHVRAIYRARRLHTPATQTTDTEPTTTRRANQWCWICEQRRICTQTPQRWEWRDCLQIT